MAKYLALSFFLFLFLLQDLSAQNFTSGGTGFEMDYVFESPRASCLTNFENGGYQYGTVNITQVLCNPTNPLTIRSAPTIVTGDIPGYFDLYFVDNQSCMPMRAVDDGQSQYYHFDLTNNPLVTVYAKSDVPGTRLDFHLAYGRNAFPDTTTIMANINKEIILSSTMTAYQLDFSEWQSRGKVNMFGIYLWEPNATVTIEKIQFGSAVSPSYTNRIKGNLFDDLNADCTKQTGEGGVDGILIGVSDGTTSFYGITNGNGDYRINVDSGSITYAVTPYFNGRKSDLYSNLCIPSKLVYANGSGNEFCCTDFGLKVKHCAQLSIEISSDRRRRCFRNNTIVRYVNNGTADVASPVVKIVYPKYVRPISSSPEWSSRIGDTLIYETGLLAAGASGYITLVDSVICFNEAIRGLAQCTQAIISPKYQCQTNEPAWDGSSVTVFPYCENGVARFVVQNVGLQDMTGNSAYRLYSNDTLVFESTFKLISGNTFQVRYPANGAVIRLEADQRPAHPGRSQPRAFVEGCGTSAAQTSVATESLVLSVPQDDLDEEIAISCITIIDSYDPNDKAASPVGITDDHLVKAGKEIKYTIRFQNTGSDVAYTVKVVDTLDANLDVATFSEAFASHPYSLQLTSDADGERSILTYTFNNINLKDSTTSEPESHGLLSFYIKSNEDLADGNTIHNKADIFFDYNSAIVTNVVDHTIGTYVPTDLTKGNSVQVTTGLFEENESGNSQRVILYPNPASDVIQVKLQEQITDAQLIILDLSGHEAYSGALKGEITSVSLAGLSSGMYLYKVQCKGEFLGIGKLIVK